MHGGSNEQLQQSVSCVQQELEHVLTAGAASKPAAQRMQHCTCTQRSHYHDNSLVGNMLKRHMEDVTGMRHVGRYQAALDGQAL